MSMEMTAWAWCEVRRRDLYLDPLEKLTLLAVADLARGGTERGEVVFAAVDLEMISRAIGELPKDVQRAGNRLAALGLVSLA